MTGPGEGYPAFPGGIPHPVTGERYAHRHAWTLAHGPIPKGGRVRLCGGDRRCVNPEHLAAWDRCSKGHPLSGDNARISLVGGYRTRICRACTREANAARPPEQKARRNAEQRTPESKARRNATQNARRAAARIRPAPPAAET
jgi:hypothetical protein